MTQILETALTCNTNGLSTIPILPAGQRGDKRPAIAWKPYQKHAATIDQLIDWYANQHHPGIAVICGNVSGNLIMIELEGRAANNIPTLTNLAKQRGLTHEWEQLTTGWAENTPSGGIHYYARCTQPTGRNQKLATTTNRTVLAETREEGGYSIIAPTPGHCHHTGKPWTLHAGGPATIPTFTPETLNQLLNIFRTLNQTPTPTATPTRPTQTPQPTPATSQDPGLKPGDDYEQKTSWTDILTPHGWTISHHNGDTTYWTRPGKTSGTSATTGHSGDRNRLYVFTTSTPFEPDTPYTKFGAYAILNHNGNMTEAARELAANGYGKTPALIINDLPTHTTTTPKNHTTTNDQPNTEGTLAKVIELNPQRALTGTDDYEALQLATHLQNTIAYEPTTPTWLEWTGTHWHPQPKTGGNAIERARAWARQLPEDEKDEIARKTKLQKRHNLKTILEYLKTDPRIAIDINKLDTHPLQLNTPTATVDLTTGKPHPHNPKDLHTKTTLHGPNPDCPTPKWDTFLTQTFGGNQPLYDYMQKLIGYSATGEVRDHILPFCFGAGANGKSVLLDTITTLLADYATIAPTGFLMAKHQAHPEEIATLKGARMVICSEVNPGDRFDEAKIKQLTGGDRLTARYMYGSSFTFTPTHKLWLAGNHQPRVEAGGTSFWRRLRLIGFHHTVKPTDMNPNLTRELIDEEGPGIMQWIIDGAVAYHRHGLTTPASVQTASRQYAEEEDHLARFVDARLIIGGGTHVKTDTKTILHAYREWCDEQGERAMSTTRFGRELKTRFGVTVAKSNGDRAYTNVCLAEGGDEHEDPWNDLGGRL